jgi:AcrR family transcriptional regulator
VARADGPSGVRERLLHAAETCVRRTGIRRTTVAQIAAEAGLSRAWLYQHFPDKAALIGAALLRTDERFWVEARATVEAAPDLPGQVAAAILFARSRPPDSLLLELREREPDAVEAMIGTGLRQMLPGMATFWHPYLRAAIARGEARADLDVTSAAEWVLRMVISLVTIPGDAVDADDPEQLRDFLRYLVRGLG